MAGSNGCSPTADRASAHAAGPDTREGREGNGRPPDSGPDSGPDNWPDRWRDNWPDRWRDAKAMSRRA